MSLWSDEQKREIVRCIGRFLCTKNGRSLIAQCESHSRDDILNELYVRLEASEGFVQLVLKSKDFEEIQRLVHHAANWRLRNIINSRRKRANRLKTYYDKSVRLFRHNGHVSARESFQSRNSRLVQDLQGLLLFLPKRERTIIELRWHEYTFLEIAKRLGISESTVRRGFENARRILVGPAGSN